MVKKCNTLIEFSGQGIEKKNADKRYYFSSNMEDCSKIILTTSHRQHQLRRTDLINGEAIVREKRKYLRKDKEADKPPSKKMTVTEHNSNDFAQEHKDLYHIGGM